MTIAIIDYGSGNLRSAAKAFARAAADASCPDEVIVTAEPDQVAAASRIVLPGVGAFGDCRHGIGAIPGMLEALQQAVLYQGRPFFGICVGMQLMAERGLEHGVHQGFGWLPGDVVALAPDDLRLKIPHMGWNTMRCAASRHPLLAGLEPDAHVYFVHGYVFRCTADEFILAETDYGGPFVAAVGRDNMVGTQFHPEKSQNVGQQIIRNFLQWAP